MDAQTRFAKTFKLSSENSKMWLLRFVENKVGVGIKYKDLKEFITVNNIESKDMKSGTITRALSKMKKSSDIDITALNVIIRCGGESLKKHTEDKIPGNVNNTVGRLISRIRHTRNDIVHTGEASLDVQDYNDYLNELRDIAKDFEKVNGVAQDTYKKEIDDIDRQQWADKVVKDEVQRYKVYVETILRFEFCLQDYSRFSSAIYNRKSDEEDRLKKENELLKKEIDDLKLEHNLAAEASREVLSPIRGENTVPHPDCYYCKQAHAPNQEGCNVM